MTYHEQNFREIITKAVCGTGKQLIHSTDYVVSGQRPSSILGCWVINHQYEAEKTSVETVKVNGTYDINVWYAYHDNSKTDVITEKINYCDEVNLESRDAHCTDEDNEVIVNVVQQPNCIECKIDQENDRISVEVEKEFIVKVIGETRVSVLVEPNH